MSFLCISMEKPPQVGQKRGPEKEEIEVLEKEPKALRGAGSESESELPSSVLEQVEDVQVEPVILEPTGLKDLPNELIVQLGQLISTAKGPTNTEKLYVAAANIRHFILTNTDYYDFFTRPDIHLEILNQLAKTYAHGNILDAAVALATDQASKLIGFTINSSIEYNEDTQLQEIKAEDVHNVKSYQEYLADAIKQHQLDTWRILTKHVETSKLALMLDTLVINNRPALLYLIDSKDPEDKKFLTEFFKILELNYNVQDETGRTPLIAAVKASDLELATLLLGRSEMGEEDIINVADNNGNTPLIYTVSQQNLPFVNLLLDYSAQVNIVNNNGESPLTVAISKNNIPLVTRLLAVDGININLMGDTPTSSAALHWAAQFGNPVIMRALLEKQGVQINLPNRQGATALHFAAKKQHDKVVDLLIRNGAQVNIQDIAGMTPLMYAAKENNQLSINYLINPPANADLTLRDAHGHTALWHARAANQGANVKILLDAHAPE